MSPRRSEKHEGDILYAHALYGRILSTARVEGKPLGELLVLGRYNLWDVFAHNALYDDCVRFSREKTWVSVRESYERTREGSLGFRAFVIGAVLWGVTKLAVSILFFRNHPVLILSVDKDSAKAYHADFRIERIYKLLHQERIAFTEIFHTVIGGGALSRAWRRRRAAIYLEGIDWLYFFLRTLRRVFLAREVPVSISGLESLSPDEQKFAEALVRKYVSVAPLVTFRLNFFRLLFRHTRVRLLVGIDDARYYHELAAAAREQAIPFYVFQHGAGHYTPYHVGWLYDERLVGERMYPEELVVWSQYWKDELHSLQSLWGERHIHVGGSAKAEHGALLVRGGKNDPVLIPYEASAPTGLVRQYVEALGAHNIPIVYKLRPDVDEQTQREVLEGVKASIQFVQDVRMPISAVLGFYSTMLYEGVVAGVPAGVLASPLLSVRGMVKNGIAELISFTSLVEDIERLQSLDVREVEQRKKRTETPQFEEKFLSILKTHL